MSTPEFGRLCESLGELLGIETAEPLRRGGLRLLRLPIQDVDVHLLHVPEADAHAASLVIELGEFDGDELQGWSALLDANHALRGASAPRFARDPETSRVILQFAFGLPDMSAADLHPKILKMVLMAREWRHQHTKPAP